MRPGPGPVRGPPGSRPASDRGRSLRCGAGHGGLGGGAQGVVGVDDQRREQLVPARVVAVQRRGDHAQLPGHRAQRELLRAPGRDLPPGLLLDLAGELSPGPLPRVLRRPHARPCRPHPAALDPRPLHAVSVPLTRAPINNESTALDKTGRSGVNIDLKPEQCSTTGRCDRRGLRPRTIATRSIRCPSSADHADHASRYVVPTSGPGRAMLGFFNSVVAGLTKAGISVHGQPGAVRARPDQRPVADHAGQPAPLRGQELPGRAARPDPVGQEHAGRGRRRAARGPPGGEVHRHRAGRRRQARDPARLPAPLEDGGRRVLRRRGPGRHGRQLLAIAPGYPVFRLAIS